MFVHRELPKTTRSSFDEAVTWLMLSAAASVSAYLNPWNGLFLLLLEQIKCVSFSDKRLTKFTLQLGTIEKLILKTSTQLCDSYSGIFTPCPKNGVSKLLLLATQHCSQNRAYVLGYSSRSTLALKKGMQDKEDYSWIHLQSSAQAYLFWLKGSCTGLAGCVELLQWLHSKPWTRAERIFLKPAYVQ